ncbi:hypothetical protein N8083_02005 [Candidatus Pacebacteria bacterium]|nr:hypothetical protein [Candidatus Paceibacterota bacterium]
MATKKVTTKGKTKPKKTSTRKSVAKKVTAKKKGATQSKKVPTKATTKKKTLKTGKALVCADTKSCFWTSDGKILRDLIELKDVLRQMEDSVYMHHVTKEKNDFADWVEHVLQDATCAEALRKSRKPTTARTVVVRHLRYYKI